MKRVWEPDIPFKHTSEDSMLYDITLNMCHLMIRCKRLNRISFRREKQGQEKDGREARRRETMSIFTVSQITTNILTIPNCVCLPAARPSDGPRQIQFKGRACKEETSGSHHGSHERTPSHGRLGAFGLMAKRLYSAGMSITRSSFMCWVSILYKSWPGLAARAHPICSFHFILFFH